ncbi:MAG: hypothetical protein R3258_09195 [Acidimicrobiia bacterium]|nr:hypothetical protein [Acidimicrobiia bacterium]
MRKVLILLAIVAMVVAACGGDTGGTEDPGEAPPADQPADPPADDGGETPADDGGEAPTPEVTEMGSFTVDGTLFAVTFLNRCIPFSGPDSDQIDLQPIAQGQGGQLNLYGNAESLEVSVQGRTVEEIGGSIAFGADSFDEGLITENNISGDRWTGAATLLDAMGGDGSVEVTWDVMIPAEAVDCSLD